MGPTKGRLFKLDFPSASFRVQIFFFWVGGSQSQKTPPPRFYEQSLMLGHLGACPTS